MIKISKKDKILLIAYIVITLLFFILYFTFHTDNNLNIITESEIKEINKAKETEVEVKYYLSIEPGEYFDTLSKITTLQVEFAKGTYIFVIRANIGNEDYKIYKFSGKYDKKLNGVHYNDIIEIDALDMAYENIYDVDERRILTEGGEGTLFNDGGILYWDDMKIVKKYHEKYNAIFEKLRTVKDN